MRGFDGQWSIINLYITLKKRMFSLFCLLLIVQLNSILRERARVAEAVEDSRARR